VSRRVLAVEALLAVRTETRSTLTWVTEEEARKRSVLTQGGGGPVFWSAPCSPEMLGWAVNSGAVGGQRLAGSSVASAEFGRAYGDVRTCPLFRFPAPLKLAAWSPSRSVRRRLSSLAL
jgi:hypothetical protein